jgi:GNAT superfamily N-acetyltransferase
MSVRLATHADIPAILVMAEAFVGESAYGMTFCRQQSAEYLAMLLDRPDVLVLIGDDVQTGVIASISNDWCAAPVCYVEKLFLMPAARGTGVARSLVAAVVEFARQHGCSHVFSTATAGMGEHVEKLFTNLFRKFDFTTCGPVLFRSL